jgi:hypothetical protein
MAGQTARIHYYHSNYADTNVRLIIHGKSAPMARKIYDLVTSRNDFFIASVVYSHTSPPADPASEPVQRLMGRGYRREAAERAAEFLRFQSLRSSLNP